MRFFVTERVHVAGATLNDTRSPEASVIMPRQRWRRLASRVVRSLLLDQGVGDGDAVGVGGAEQASAREDLRRRLHEPSQPARGIRRAGGVDRVLGGHECIGGRGQEGERGGRVPGQEVAGEGIEGPAHADVLAPVGVGVHAEHEIIVADRPREPGTRLGKLAKHVHTLRSVGCHGDVDGSGPASRKRADPLPDCRPGEVESDHVGAPRSRAARAARSRRRRPPAPPCALQVRATPGARPGCAPRGRTTAPSIPRRPSARAARSASCRGAPGRGRGPAASSPAPRLRVSGRCRSRAPARTARGRPPGCSRAHRARPPGASASTRGPARAIASADPPAAEATVSSRRSCRYSSRRSLHWRMRSARSGSTAAAASAKIARPVAEVDRRPPSCGKETPPPASPACSAGPDAGTTR